MSNFTTNRMKISLELLLTPVHQSHQSQTLPPSILRVLGDEYAFPLVMQIIYQRDLLISHISLFLLQIVLPTDSSTTSPTTSPYSFHTRLNQIHWVFSASMRKNPPSYPLQMKAWMRSLMPQPSKLGAIHNCRNLRSFPGFPPKKSDRRIYSPHLAARPQGF
jgi:hypothetical protein